MKQTVAWVAVLVLAAGCGNNPDTSPKAVQPGSTAGVADGNYAVGTDLEPGVYTTRRKPVCTGFRASRANFDLDSDNDPDAYLGDAAAVNDLLRIHLHGGEFFTSLGCDGWLRETDPATASPDPATLAGGCEILLGGEPTLVDQTLSALRKEQMPDTDMEAYDLQDRLFAVTTAQLLEAKAKRDRALGPPAGELGDFLDAPTYFVEDGRLDPRVTRTVARIRALCQGE